MIALLMTIFFLLVLFLTLIANNNDDVNPKDNCLSGQFMMNGYQNRVRFDRNENGGGLPLFSRSNRL